MNKIDLLVVYENAKDIDRKFCVRHWETNKPKELLFKADSYDEIKAHLNKYSLIPTLTFEEDDPVIKEVYLWDKNFDPSLEKEY